MWLVREFRSLLGLREHAVVGWVGSFRRFRPVDMLLRAFAGIKENCPKRSSSLSETVYKGLPLSNCPGAWAQTHIYRVGPLRTRPTISPSYGSHSGSRPGGTRLSLFALKTKEYMSWWTYNSCSCPWTVAGFPRRNENDLPVTTGNEAELGLAHQELILYPRLRDWIGSEARRSVEKAGSWSHQLSRVIQLLESTRPGAERG
jgi:glycosyltransferase involved in cell wall biosynthesis